MKLSVIIPTFNGAQKLPNILEALDKQSFKDFEVVVAIDGSTDNSIAVLEGYLPETYTLAYFYQENKGRAAIRNFGATNATGELLLFFDDDLRPVESCLEIHVKLHKKNSDSILVGQLQEDSELCKTSFHEYKAHLSKGWQQALLERSISLQQPYLSAANFSISKELFFQLGGFDARLTDAEDEELAVRILKNGNKIIYCPEALAWHDDFFSLQRYIKRQKEYKQAMKRLVELSLLPEELMVLKEQNVHKLNLWYKKPFLYLFSRRFWSKMLDRYPLTWLPKKARFKLFDWVIHSSSLV